MHHYPTDENTGEFAGITREVLDKIGYRSSTKYKLLLRVTSEYLRENNINVLSNVEFNKINYDRFHAPIFSLFESGEKYLWHQNN